MQSIFLTFAIQTHSFDINAVSNRVLTICSWRYTQTTLTCLVQRELTGFQTKHRFEDLVALNQESVTQYESQLNSPLGAHILSHFVVKEFGKDLSLRCILFLELKQYMKL
jgi:hypothetical protein